MQMGKRLVIYFFYDKDGIADNYVDYFLNGLKEVTDKFVIVANGKITPESRSMFLKYTDDIIVRKNEGLDVWAYKTAIEYVGWEELRKYYEVCLINATIMGPIYPFEEMFSKMDENKDLDFWGINRYLTVNANPYNNPYGYIPEHIQSHFIVYRNKFLKTKELKIYWDNIPQINSYEESVGKHESYFTKFFSDQGFNWTTYIHNDEEKNYSNYFLMDNPLKALKKYRCPIFKRRSFFHDYNYFLLNQNGEMTVNLFDFLKNKTDYPTDLILENIIRTCNQYDFVRNLNLIYVLSSKKNNEKKQTNKRVALIIHSYYKDCIDEIFLYSSNVPEYVDIYINTPIKDNIVLLKTLFGELPNHVEIKLIENRGRDVSSLLIASENIVKNYDYVCFYHDKKVKQITPLAVGESFFYKISECALHNKVYIENIIYAFDNESMLGMLTNEPPYNGVYINNLGNEWGPNFDITYNLSKKLNLKVPIERDKPPIAPLGTVFWFRTKALNKLFNYNWKYEDFPKEPNKIDGSILHAIERVYPFVVQDAGYYPAYVMPDTYASQELTNLTHFCREYNIILNKNNIYGNFLQKCIQLNFALLKTNMIKKLVLRNKYLFKVKEMIRGVLPQKMYEKLKKIVV